MQLTLNGDEPCIFENLTLQLWHMVKGRVAVSVGFGSVLAAPALHSVFFFDTFYLNIYELERGKASLYEIQSPSFTLVRFLALASEKTGLVFHYHTYLLPFNALKR